MRAAGLDRRTLLGTAAVFGALAAEGPAALFRFVTSASAQQPAVDDVFEAFGPEHVKRLAQTLATKPFSKPRIDLPEPFNKLGYDQYRDIRFRVEQSIWRGEKLDYELQLFPMGWLYDVPVELWIAENGRARQLRADGTLFSVGPLIGGSPQAAPYGFSGFRVHGPLNRADYLDEYVVFQGASYMRAVGRGQGYGVSARGLAVNTARPGGEEFPLFRAFWIEKPKAGAGELVVHALLDSPSVSGAYRMAITPGAATIMDIDATIYPRRQIASIGLAPLTSMFLHGPANRRIQGDFRPAVHDSEGLAILNGKGERLWRLLTNPKKLQSSAFVDKDPKGFGLLQRDRAFANFEDLEARYERRPSIWVEPKGAWGEGAVELIEIPADEEIHDNIVAFWRPSKPVEEQKPFSLVYRLHWGEEIPVTWTGLRARKTRVGNGRKGVVMFVIDFDGPGAKDARELPVADVRASAGTVVNAVVQRHPEITGLRCSFELLPQTAELVELRLVLKSNDQHVSEFWLYRWTRA